MYLKFTILSPLLLLGLVAFSLLLTLFVIAALISTPLAILYLVKKSFAKKQTIKQDICQIEYA